MRILNRLRGMGLLTPGLLMAVSLVALAEPAPDSEFGATLHALDRDRGFLVADHVRYPLADMFRLFDADGNRMTEDPSWGSPVYLEIYDGQVIRAHLQPEDIGEGSQ